MRHNAADTKVVKSIMKQLDAIQRKHGSLLTRKAANRWVTGQRDRARLGKERAALEKKLAEVNSRLS